MRANGVSVRRGGTRAVKDRRMTREFRGLGDRKRKEEELEMLSGVESQIHEPQGRTGSSKLRKRCQWRMIIIASTLKAKELSTTLGRQLRVR